MRRARRALTLEWHPNGTDNRRRAASLAVGSGSDAPQLWPPTKDQQSPGRFLPVRARLVLAEMLQKQIRQIVAALAVCCTW